MFTFLPTSSYTHFVIVSGKPAALFDQTNPDWAPSVNLGYQNTPQSSRRYERATERKVKKKRLDVAESLIQLSNYTETSRDEQVDIMESVTPATCRFELKGNLSIETCNGRKPTASADDSGCPSTINKLTMEELNRLTVENLELKAEIKSNEISPENFDGNDERVRYFTGLPSYLTLMALFNFLKPFIPRTAKNALSDFQMLVLVLMRLRLNVPVQDLAYRFGVSKSTVSRSFLSMIHVMYIRMKSLIIWPDREELSLTMPMEFRKHFGLKVATIIDCFEVFIERPSNLLARASTWSSYKHHNTVKFLIGITPQGTVSFLSEAWGGRASDKYITENSGFLNKLLPGDVVLADRGFNIEESVGLMCAELKIPAFTKGKSQLSPMEVEMTRKIAHVRIHVERVIGLVRNKYTILQGPLPLDFLCSEGTDTPVVDKIATVCCALVNMCDSVVPFD